MLSVNLASNTIARNQNGGDNIHLDGILDQPISEAWEPSVELVVCLYFLLLSLSKNVSNILIFVYETGINAILKSLKIELLIVKCC